MNVRDSEIICGLLTKEGFKLTDDSRKADVLIFNTCSVRQHAEDRVFSLIGEYINNYLKPGPGKKVPLVGVVGCMAKNYEGRIFDKSDYISFAAGPADISKIPSIIKDLLVDRGSLQKRIWETEGIARPEEIYHTGFYEKKGRAYVVISEGCSNFCSYCIVPYVRGPIRNRRHEDILKEINSALQEGITSITLLGQNVNAYRDNGVDFIRLLEMANNLKGLEELDFMTSHPKDASTGLFKAIKSLDKVKKSLHLPVQSGSDRILKLMNRKYTAKNYLDLVENYRKIVKGGRVTTDIIVGFPTESQADFKETVDLFKKAGFNFAFIFKYSPRPNTEAFKMHDDVEKKEKERRHALMLKLQKGMLAVICFVFLFAISAFAAVTDKVKVSFLSANYHEAIKEGNDLIAKDRYSPELYYYLGLSYLKTGEYIKAAQSFRAVINNFKEVRLKEESRIGLGDTYLLRGEFASAENIYTELLKDNPKTKFRGQISQRLERCAPKNGSFYSVQVGAFSNPDNAKNLTQKLLDSGYPAYVEESGTLAERSYKVRVGRLASQEEAGKMEKELSGRGYPTKVCP